MSYTTDVLEEHIKELEAKLDAIRNHIDTIPTWLIENFRWEKRKGVDSWEMWKFAEWAHIAKELLGDE